MDDPKPPGDRPAEPDADRCPVCGGPFGDTAFFCRPCRQMFCSPTCLLRHRTAPGCQAGSPQP
jgi:hypothetical protein